VLGVYYQQTDRFFDQDVIFAFLPIPGCDIGTATVCGPEFTGALADPDDQFTAYNKISETDGETWSVYANLRSSRRMRAVRRRTVRRPVRRDHSSAAIRTGVELADLGVSRSSGSAVTRFFNTA